MISFNTLKLFPSGIVIIVIEINYLYILASITYGVARYKLKKVEIVCESFIVVEVSTLSVGFYVEISLVF